MSKLPEPESIINAPILLSTIFFSATLYFIALSIYRLFLSPIAHFPGSKLAALTGWYEAYYDIYKGGQFTFQVAKWHQQYGPIIRINPYEIHISDPDFHDTAFSSSLHVDKLHELEHRFALPLGTHATVKHELHARRRRPLNPYFSKGRIIPFGPYIQDRTDRLCGRLQREYKGSGKVLSIGDAWAAYNTDILIYYTFAWTYDFLDFPDFKAPFTESVKELGNTSHVGTHFQWLVRLLQSLPDPVLAVLNPAMRPIIQLQDVCTRL